MLPGGATVTTGVGPVGVSPAADAGPSGISVSAATMPAAARGLYNEDGARTALPREVRELVIEIQWRELEFQLSLHRKL
ncbi:hypothetical protein GCM10009765_00910 [Fodinicola feengrottensis]|uniref:Uncharacterized protein n=1 Tax=Fodinicola feengrottensis TaxID=435914 RepID=A0ABP4RMM5_9ACTN